MVNVSKNSSTQADNLRFKVIEITFVYLNSKESTSVKNINEELRTKIKNNFNSKKYFKSKIILSVFQVKKL